MKKPGVCLFAILVVVSAATNTSTTSASGQMLTPSAPTPSRVHHLIGTSQLDCTEHASQGGCAPCAHAICSTVAMTKGMNYYGGTPGSPTSCRSRHTANHGSPLIVAFPPSRYPQGQLTSSNGDEGVLANFSIWHRQALSHQQFQV